MSRIGNPSALARTGWLMLLFAFPFAARGQEVGAVDLNKPIKSNIPDVEGCLSSNGFTFTSSQPSPGGEPYFYVRYDVPATEAGTYRISIKGPPSGARGYSRYSLAIDDSPPYPVPLAWRVGEEKEGWHD